MRSLLLISIFCIFPLFSNSQHVVEGSILGLPHENISLLEYFGDKHRFVDSTRTDGNGWFSIPLKKDTPAGLYSLAIGKNPLFNFIYNNEDITLKYEVGENKLPEFIFSIENLIYYDYLVQADRYLQKANMLTEVLRYYNERDSFYLYTEDHFFSLQEEFRNYAEKIKEEYPHTLVSHIVMSDRPMMFPAGFNWDEFLEYNRSHFLDDTDFSDTLLLSTNVLTGKAIDYMSFYSNSNMNKEAQEYYFIQAVDTILHKAMDNGKVYDFIMEYLIEGFDMYGFDKVITHIAENYEPANTCVNEDRKSELQKRVENLRKLAVGNQAPDIAIRQADGSTFRIEDIQSDHILIVFWASWCPHCEAMMPDIKKLYNDNNMVNFEVLSISIDTSATEYAAAIASQATSWINYSDFKGWDTEAAIDFSIYATPSMFLIDKNRKILARPVSVYELRNALLDIEQ